MGIIVAKFRKKKSTYDLLEKLDNEITSIQEFQRSTEQARRKIVFRFLLLAVIIYLFLAFILYLYYSQIPKNQKLLCVIPLVASPLVIWVIKRFLTWYYNRKIRKNEYKLVTLKDKKKEILDNVMETETYKVAKKILDKFGDQKKSSSNVERTPLPNKNTSLVLGSTRLNQQTVLRQRNLAAQNTLKGRLSFGGLPNSPGTPAQNRQLALPTPVASMNVVPSRGPMPGTPFPLPRGILPRERSVLDKMVDYLVGDGPSNRYALICKKCNSHNGMALKEEFEYLSFRCCYCSAFNPSRKKKPTGPKFEMKISPLSKASGPESSDSDKNSLSESDSESKPIITEPRESPGKTSDFYKFSDAELKTSDIDGSQPVITEPRESPGKTSDIDKLLDAELKTSDIDASPMEVDSPIIDKEPTAEMKTNSDSERENINKD